jgi:uncharacterized protein YbaR (Trm112 family)
MEKKLLDILVCPISKARGSLIYDRVNQELICKSSRLAYPIQDEIPIMIPDQARSLTLEEVEKLSQRG